MKNLLSANAFVSFMLWLVTLVNVAFAIEGGSALPEYMKTVYMIDVAEIAFWLIAGIAYLTYLVCNRRSTRRLGILRYDGQNGEWYYQR